MAQEFVVLATQPWVYTDATNRVVNGFRVFFRIVAFDEVHELFVPNLSPDVVKAAISKMVKDRTDLSKI